MQTLLTIVIIVVAIIVLPPLFYVSLKILFAEFAKRNFMFTFRPSGEIKAIMDGEDRKSFVFSIENYRIDPWDFDLFKGSDEAYAAYLHKAAVMKKEEEPGFFEDKKIAVVDGTPRLTTEFAKAIAKANAKTKFERFFPGIVWVGISPRRVFSYRFKWLKYGQGRDDKGRLSDKMTVHARDEIVTSIYFRYTQYAIVLEGMEIASGSLGEKTGKSSVQVKCVLVYETETVNPLKSLFRTSGQSSAGDWIQAISSGLSAESRAWLGLSDWDTLVGDQVKVDAGLRKIVQKINGLDKDGVPLKRSAKNTVGAVRDYGQKVLKLRLVSIDLHEDVQKAIDAIFKAEKAAEEKVINAEAQKEADLRAAVGKQALAAAPLKGKAQGLEEISKVKGGRDMYVSEQIGNIRVFAPGGNSGMMFNINTDSETETKTEAKGNTEAKVDADEKGKGES